MKSEMKMRHKLIVIGVICLSLGDYVYSTVIPPLQGKIGNLSRAAEIYAMHHDIKFPASLDELTLFAYNCYDYGDKPLLKKEDLIDPWGTPIFYECSSSGRGYIFISSGPDKKMGTRDDIIDGWPTSYVMRWEAKLAQSVAAQEANTSQGAAAEAPPPAVTQNPPLRNLTQEEREKESEWIRQQVEEGRRAHRVFLRNAKVAGITLILAICAVTVWAVARKRARRK